MIPLLVRNQMLFGIDDVFVGWWTLQPAHGPDQPDDPGVADLGYRLVRRHWGRGLAAEGARELVHYGFEEVGLARIIAQTLTVNAQFSKFKKDVSSTIGACVGVI